MKCRFCDGSGKDYWCLNGVPYPCPVCNGTGSINNIQCPSCEGFGQISEQTNEEWFTSLSTEEKAKTIICLAVNSMNKKQKGLIENDVNEIIRWLKEKHI